MTLPVDVVSKFIQELINVSKKLEGTVKSVLISGLQYARINVVDHNASWVSRMDEVRIP